MAYGATVSVTILNVKYDFAFAFSIEPMKLIGQIFSFFTDLMKHWITKAGFDGVRLPRQQPRSLI